MYIPYLDNNELIDRVDETQLHKSRFQISDDICSRSRHIIIHDGVGLLKSDRCTIINLSVLDSRMVFDTYSNSENVLVKTVYNGYIINDDPHDDVLRMGSSQFKISEAYTSMIGVWGVDYSDIFALHGLTVLDNFDMMIAIKRMKQHIYVSSPTNYSVTINISFDDVNFTPVLPLVLPQFYSRRHSELNGYIPMVVDTSLIEFGDIADEYTKISHLKLNNAGITYKDWNDNEIPADRSIDNYTPPNIAASSMITLIGEVFASLFEIFNRLQLRDLIIVHRSILDKVIVTRDRFSFNKNMTDYHKTVENSIKSNSRLNTAFINMKDIYGNVDVIVAMTDLKFEFKVIFNTKIKGGENLKSIHYSKTIFDELDVFTPFNTSITQPICMMG